MEKRMSRMSTFGSTWIPPLSWECLSPTISCYEKMRKENEEEVMGPRRELTPEKELDEWSKQTVKEGGFYVDPSVLSEDGGNEQEEGMELKGKERELEEPVEQKMLDDAKRPVATSPFIDTIPSSSSLESISLPEPPQPDINNPVVESSETVLPSQDDVFAREVEPKTLIIPH